MTSRPHDALFKSAFELPTHIEGLFSGCYSPAVINRVDWRSARVEPGSFIDTELVDSHTDLLLSAHLRADGQDSARSKRIYARHEREHGFPLAPVLTFAPNPAELEGVAEVTPQFTVKVLDVSRLSNEEIDGRVGTVVGKLALWLLRDGRDGLRLLDNLRIWAWAILEALETPSGAEFVSRMFKYVYDVADDVHYESFRAKIHEFVPDKEREIMTMAEQLRQEGRQ